MYNAMHAHIIIIIIIIIIQPMCYDRSILLSCFSSIIIIILSYTDICMLRTSRGVSNFFCTENAIFQFL